MRSQFTINSISLALALLLLPGLCALSLAQEPATKLDSILALHKTALGDFDSVLNLKTIRREAEIEKSDSRGTSVDYYSFPDHSVLSRDFGVLKHSMGCDGRNSWSTTRLGKIRRNLTRDRALIFNDMYLWGYCYLRDNWDRGRIEARNDTVISETAYYQLALFPKRSDSIFAFINTESGRLEHYISFGPKLENIVHLSDFRRVNGIEMAFHQEQEDSDQKIITAFTSQQVNIELPDSLFLIPKGDLPSTKREFVDDFDSATVKFSFDDNHVIIKGVVNGKNKFKFMLDTGASSTLISMKMAKKFGLDLVERDTIHGGSGEASVKYSAIDSIIIGSVIWRPGTIKVLADKNMSSDLFRGYDAILGSDFFSVFPVRVDFDKKTVTLYNNEKVELPTTGIPVAINISSGQARKEMKLDGRPIKTVIDLGNYGNVSIFSSYRWFYVYSDEVRYEKAHHLSQGIGSVARSVKLSIADSLVFDDIRISEPLLELMPRPDGFQDRKSIEALIGCGLLKRFNLLIDYPNKVIYFDRRENYKD